MTIDLRGHAHEIRKHIAPCLPLCDEPDCDGCAIERECAKLEADERRIDREADRIGERAAEAAAREIESMTWNSAVDANKHSDGMLYVLDELQRADATDEIAGVTPADDVCRRLRREAG